MENSGRVMYRKVAGRWPLPRIYMTTLRVAPKTAWGREGEFAGELRPWAAGG